MKTGFETMTKIIDENCRGFSKFLYCTTNGTYYTNGFYAVRSRYDRTCVHTTNFLFDPKTGNRDIAEAGVSQEDIQKVLDTGSRYSEVMSNDIRERLLKIIRSVKPCGKNTVLISLNGTIDPDSRGYNLSYLRDILDCMYPNTIRINEVGDLWFGNVCEGEAMSEAILPATIIENKVK